MKGRPEHDSVDIPADSPEARRRRSAFTAILDMGVKGLVERISAQDSTNAKAVPKLLDCGD